MKRLLAALLCVLMVLALFPVSALADYSTTSNRGVELEYPAERDYFVWPFTAQIQTYKNGGSIYLMPMPEKGHGNLGTVANQTTVVVLAERGGFFFFVTGEGPARSITAQRKRPITRCSPPGVRLSFSRRTRTVLTSP